MLPCHGRDHGFESRTSRMKQVREVKELRALLDKVEEQALKGNFDSTFRGLSEIIEIAQELRWKVTEGRPFLSRYMTKQIRLRVIDGV